MNNANEAYLYCRRLESITSNGKTLIVCYRTLSFFALRLKKKLKFVFFRFFKYKITIEPVRFAPLFKFFNIKCSLRFEKFFSTIEHVRFASLDSQFNIILLRFASIFKFLHINMFASLRNKFSN